MHRLAVAIDHPIQYHAPLYSHLARDGRFDLRVFYMSDRGARAYYDRFAKREVVHDNPILEGYDYVFLREGEPRSEWGKKNEFVNFGLARAIVDWKPDAVYFHGYTNPSFWHAIRVCRKAGIDVLFRGENEEVLPRPWWRNAARETFLKIFLLNVDAVLWIGQENREFFLRRGWPEERMFHVPYSVDNDYFAVPSEERNRLRVEIRKRYGFDREARLFIYTHKLRPTMRPLDAIEGFLRAIPLMKRPAGLIVCGDGEMMSACGESASKAPPGSIVMAGYLSQKELRDHMLASDVMINPAIEPWGCSVNEGLACGLVQISSDMVVGWRDMVRPENGVMYPMGDLDGLCRPIADMVNLEDARIDEMREASLTVARNLSFDACAEGLDAAMKCLSSRMS